MVKSNRNHFLIEQLLNLLINLPPLTKTWSTQALLILLQTVTTERNLCKGHVFGLVAALFQVPNSTVKGSSGLLPYSWTLIRLDYWPFRCTAGPPTTIPSCNFVCELKCSLRSSSSFTYSKFSIVAFHCLIGCDEML